MKTPRPGWGSYSGREPLGDEVGLVERKGCVPWQSLKFALERRHRPRVQFARIGEDDEDRIPRRGLLVEVFDETKDTLDPGVDDQKSEAIDHEGSRAPFVQEGRRRGKDLPKTLRVHAAYHPGQRRHAHNLPAFWHGGHGAGGDPQERRPGLREDAEEGDRCVFRVEGEIAQAPPQRKTDDTPPLCVCKRAETHGGRVGLNPAV